MESHNSKFEKTCMKILGKKRKGKKRNSNLENEKEADTPNYLSTLKNYNNLMSINWEDERILKNKQSQGII